MRQERVIYLRMSSGIDRWIPRSVGIDQRRDDPGVLSFGVATLLGMLPVTFFYTSFGSAVLENRLVTWLGGLTMVVLFFLLPRWIERYDLFSLRRHFAHQNPSDDHDA